MSRTAPVSLVYFGKIASRGDFVRSAQQGALTRMLDEWLSRGLERVAADPRWKQRYDQLAACRFAFLGVRSKVALAGHLIPSVDASGRRFPFVSAGSFDIPAPLPFMARAPLAMTGLWSRLERFGREACAAPDATALLGQAAQWRLEIEVQPTPPSGGFDDWLARQTVDSLEALLRTDHPAFELHRSVLALGLLLQPVPASGVSRIDKGLALPLPDDPLQVPWVAAFWMSLVTPFLSRGDFELALFVLRRQPTRGAELCIGFAGGAPATLQAIFDADQRDAAFVKVVAAEWVDAHVGDADAVRKLSSYLQQPQLSMRQATRTFMECFLGE